MSSLLSALRELSTLSEQRSQQLKCEKEIDAALARACAATCEETAARFLLMSRQLNRVHCDSIRKVGSPLKYTKLIVENMAQVRRLHTETEAALGESDACAALAQLMRRDDWRPYTSATETPTDPV